MILLTQIFIFYIFVKKIQLHMEDQMNVEMRLYGYSYNDYRAQNKRVNNLKFVL